MEFVASYQDKISIITPFFNAEKYLTDCVDSIMEQSYTNWELILVNDQSTDHSNIIAESFTKKDSRICLIQNHTKGLIPALRIAYQKSTGNYITRMDADDIMSNNRLEIMLTKLQTSGHGYVCIGKVKYFSDQGIGDGYLKYEKWLNTLTESQSNFSEIYRECSIPSPNFLIHKTDFDKIGGFDFDTYPEDYDLAFRMYQNGMKITSVDDITLFWRDHSTRSTRTQDHYQSISFIPLKVNHFLSIDYDSKRSLILWGAGKKGKMIAKELLSKNVEFIWITDNPNKIGKDIYGIAPKSPFDTNFQGTQVIIAVSNPDELRSIDSILTNKSCNYWSFF